MVLLEVKNLKMYYHIKDGSVRAVDDVSFSLDRGETLGVVGESGCGKSSLAYTLIRVLPPNAQIAGGKILFQGKDLLKLEENEMNKIRWAEISMIFQSAMNALNPVFKVGEMAMEALRTHGDVKKHDARIQVENLFEEMGLEKSRMRNYPHEFSGGMRQRAIIATSLICSPKIVIADEPTTALDVIVQEQILQRFKELQEKMEIALILISHDVSIVAETCEKIAIMYAGRLVELGESKDIFANPQHPYTVALLQSFPSVHGELKELSAIPGKPPNLINPTLGCRFKPRCWLHDEKRCKDQGYELLKADTHHYTSCPRALDCDLKVLYGSILGRQV